MKVLALNSSPRSEDQSKTTMMLSRLVRGMREAGAEVEVVELRRKNIRNCIGCFTCWTKTPGVCVHNDDMTNELFPKWCAADVAVYASPLYHYTFTASMKAFIERTLPVAEPFLVRKDGKTTHPVRTRPPKAVVLSVAGFPEMAIFDQLSSYVRFLFKKGLMAEIYRPSAEAMREGTEGGPTKDALEATALGGRELVEKGEISPETMKRMTQAINEDFDQVARLANVFWKSCITEKATPKEFVKRDLIPRPDSIETFMDILGIGFNRKEAGDTRAVLQFTFSGEETGACFFTIADGTIRSSLGQAANPDLIIEAPFEVWMDILTGKADGQQMFLQQKFTAKGDLPLLMGINRIFSR